MDFQQSVKDSQFVRHNHNVMKKKTFRLKLCKATIKIFLHKNRLNYISYKILSRFKNFKFYNNIVFINYCFLLYIPIKVR